MFGKRTVSEPVFGKPMKQASGPALPPQVAPSAAAPQPPDEPPMQVRPTASLMPTPKNAAPTRMADNRSDDYYQIKSTIFNALIDTIDLAQLAQLDPESAREEIRDIVNEIISIKAVVMSIAEQEHLLQD